MQTTALQQQAWKHTAARPSYVTHLPSAGIGKTISQQALGLLWYSICCQFKNKDMG